MKLTDTPQKISFRQFLQWVNRPSDFLDACTRRYGDDFTVQFPDQKIFTFVSHPKALEAILTAPPETFDFKQSTEMFGPLVRDNSLAKLNGKPHQRHRKLMMPPFHGERMRLYGRLICDLTEQMMKSWNVGESVNLFPCINKVTLNILLNVVFGSTEEEHLEQLRRRALDLIRFASSRVFAFHIFIPALRVDLGWNTWGRFLRLQDEVDRLLYAEIAQRRQYAQPERTDILSMLLAARDEEGQPMSNEELYDELVTLLLSGYDPTAMTLVWSLYWIHKLPRVRERLLEEMDTISDPSDTKAISQLPYLTATCQETLRLFPSLFGFLRVAKEPFEMMGYEFPAGSQIMGNIYSAHRRQEVYRNPEEFKPERFLEGQFSPYELLPFGGANRLCIGSAFVQLQMKLMLFTILSRCQLVLADSRPLHLHPARRASGVIPAKDVQMVVTARNHCQSNVAVMT